MTKRSMLPLLLATAACAPFGSLPRAPRGEAVLTVRGAIEGAPFRLGRADLAALPRRDFLARDPLTGREGKFAGVALALLLRAQPLEPGVDTLVVITGGREALPIPFGTVRQYGPILADELDGTPLPDLRLVWPNLDQLGLDRDVRAPLWWAQQVTTLELVAWGRTWARALRPPPGSSDAARRGAGQFALRCVACHMLNGFGGERGPDLTGAARRLGPEPFRAAVRVHPQWSELVGIELLRGDAVLGEIEQFLAAAAEAGPSPPDEPPRAVPRR